MIYKSDPSAIRSAEDEVTDAQYQIRISEIEKSISKLEEARDRETDAIDEMISKLEDYKNSWEDITSAYAESQEDLIAEQILGAGWETDILNGRLDTLDNFKNQYIAVQQAMADAAWKSANEQIRAAKEAAKGAGGSEGSASTISTGDSVTNLSSSNSNINDTSQMKALKAFLSLRKSILNKYASGTDNAKKGLNLVGEDGEELFLDNDGHVAIVTKPTLIPMEGGEVVKNEQDTKKLLDSNNLKPLDNIGVADIDGKEAEYTIKVNIETNGKIPDVNSINKSITLTDGTVLTPLQHGDPMLEMQQKFDAYIDKIGGDISSIATPVSFIQKDMERMVNGLNSVNNVNNTNNKMQQIIQQITLNCPNVTNNSGIEYIQKELGHLALRAEQESMKH